MNLSCKLIPYVYIYKSYVCFTEFEASHGTVADLWNAHQRGEKTSMNPLGMTEAILNAMLHSAFLAGGPIHEEMQTFTTTVRKSLHNTFRYGQGTWDMAGPDKGYTTEAFIDKVAWRLGRYLEKVWIEEDEKQRTFAPDPKFRRNYNVDRASLESLFQEYDAEKKGAIGLDQLELILAKIGVAPLKDPLKRSSASSDKDRNVVE